LRTLAKILKAQQCGLIDFYTMDTAALVTLAELLK
jgi:hypothetical protein